VLKIPLFSKNLTTAEQRPQQKSSFCRHTAEKLQDFNDFQGIFKHKSLQFNTELLTFF